ncbi:WYL domain-containing protein [Antarcticibacterium arcticum]|uniref:WYL domain-containing protein n=1 Tax=Antarcticibacterium arcticum TaxID=2585771 RepID=A0A5B8YI27_9FLAO|nr:WYL domain-containing protein [Antarcticibacterium arcticum]QED37600.1 WYL domain-containing protein [Antarcticibacterium arcticum]
MSRQEGIQRHRFIIHQLTKKPSTFKEIRSFLKLQEEITGDRLTCSLRTFQRAMIEISGLYQVDIKYDKKRKVYYIEEDEREAQSERLMESFDLFNAIRMGNSFGNHLIFEGRRALGTEHMHGLLHAIRNRLEVSFNYSKFVDGSVTKRTVHPVAIKEARNRWYLLARDASGDVVKNFGLDRMAGLEIGSKKFREIKDFDPSKEYKYTFGIINGTGERPERIILSFTPKEGRYINSLPLHHSQKEILKNKAEHIFEYELVPTYDFKMEILSFGDTVKVLEPESLRKDIAKQLEKALAHYKI